MKKCPGCDVVMHEVKKLDVNIDVCPKCMGVWLDKNELEKIIEKSFEESAYDTTNRQTDNDYSYRHKDHDDHDGHYKHGHDDEKYNDKKGYPRKRRGGISDIFGDLFG